jgi:hypothetical protein
LPRVYIDIGHVTFGGLAGYYEKDVPIAFGSVSDAESIANFRVANAGAIKAMKDLDAWLKAQEAQPTNLLSARKIQRAAEGYRKSRRAAGARKEIGERDLERNLAALKEAATLLSQVKRLSVSRKQADKPQQLLSTTPEDN